MAHDGGVPAKLYAASLLSCVRQCGLMADRLSLGVSCVLPAGLCHAGGRWLTTTSRSPSRGQCMAARVGFEGWAASLLPL